MASWREYQEEAAAFFRSLGLEVTADERLDGVRGSHDVDVVVRGRRAGLQLFWVVECKQRQRRVEKLHVAALAEIVRDLGADRGVLLSEVGFQTGAVRMAFKSNVTLASLAQLRAETAEELLTLNLGECRLRLSHLRGRLRAETGRWPAPYALDFSGYSTHRAYDLPAFIEGVTTALDELEAELEAFESANT